MKDLLTPTIISAEPVHPDAPAAEHYPASNRHRVSSILEDENVRCFTDQVGHLYDLFNEASLETKPVDNATAEEVLRAATWWFLHGRMKLEPLLRTPSTLFSKMEDQIILIQVVTSLAKCLWLIETSKDKFLRDEGEPSLNKTGADKGEDAILSFRLALLPRIRWAIGLLYSQELFPISGQQLQNTNTLDSTIWIQYPPRTIDVRYILTGNYSDTAHQQCSLSEIFPLGDTSETFHYGGMHVELYLLAENSNSQQIKYPATLSIIRRRDEENISIVIGTQDGLIDLTISSKLGNHPTWDDVTWLNIITSLEVKLPTGFRLQIRCGCWDYKTLKGMYKYVNQTLYAFQKGLNEEVLCEMQVESTHLNYGQNLQTRIFPKEPIKNCTLRLFHIQPLQQTAAELRKVHRGFRIALLTPSTYKKTSVISQDFTSDEIIQFDFLKGDSVNKALKLKLNSENPEESLILSFSHYHERSNLLAHLTGTFVCEWEYIITQAQIHSFSIATVLESLNPRNIFDEVQWHSLKVIGRELTDFEVQKLERGYARPTASLRVILDSSQGRIADRINVGLGELKIRRNVIASGHELHVLRQEQDDMTVSISESLISSEIPRQMKTALEDIKRQSSIRTYTFHNLADLHHFQEAVTGFSVLFDSTVASFAISRRRMMVPIHKEWSIPHTRLQILKRGKMIQLAAFFEGFSHGKCMNFVLRETDVIKKTLKAGKTFLKIVDAKFSLPVGGKRGPGREMGFISLDLLDYPTEHDNILIGFATDRDLEMFCSVLPAAVRTK
ncbi:hypothetical protein B0O99DRAFT_522819 [Bisporella sp. PMI_857]|nr:hypothetical protein B0O99DRAFT_522819 [Bisporella sp. PMI_857]